MERLPQIKYVKQKIFDLLNRNKWCFIRQKLVRHLYDLRQVSKTQMDMLPSLQLRVFDTYNIKLRLDRLPKTHRKIKKWLYERKLDEIEENVSVFLKICSAINPGKCKTARIEFLTNIIVQNSINDLGQKQASLHSDLSCLKMI